MDETFFIIYGIVLIGVCVVMGLISKHINENKGYYGGFAWGFFLGIIGIIVVACRSDNRSYQYSNTTRSTYDTGLSAAATEFENSRLLREGGWRCVACQKVNPKYVTTCECGNSLTKNKIMIAEEKKEEAENKANEKESIEALLKYKQLLDAGAISEAEFEAKKKELLKL